TMEEAVDRAVENYPKIEVARLKVKQEGSLRKTAWDFGNTQVFTGGEEIGSDGDGVYTTIGIQQQNINLLGISSGLKLQNTKIALAETTLNLDKLEVEMQVKEAYGAAYIAKSTLMLYTRLDSIYAQFQRAAQIRYEVEETSKLAFLAASSQAKQIILQKKQAEFDYL